MARNTKGRLGKDLEPKTPSIPDSVAAMTEGGGLNFATPTDFVELPSQGRFYPPDHPLSGEETIEIKYMTAREEDILSSKTLIKQGVALERLLKSVIVDKRIKPSDMLTGDRNAILVASRITGYGAEYNTKITCPSCMQSGDYEYDLSEVVPSMVDEDEEATWTDENTMLINLPLTKIEVEVRLLTGKEEMHLARLQQSKKKKKLIETVLSDTLKSIIVSINGESSRDLLEDFIKNVPAKDLRYLRAVYSRNTPNIDMSHDFECDNCSYQTVLEVPFTTDFFWPK